MEFYDKNQQQFAHIDRELLAASYPYTGGKMDRDFRSRLLTQIAERKKWGKLAGTDLLVSD